MKRLLALSGLFVVLASPAVVSAQQPEEETEEIEEEEDEETTDEEDEETTDEETTDEETTDQEEDEEAPDDVGDEETQMEVEAGADDEDEEDDGEVAEEEDDADDDEDDEDEEGDDEPDQEVEQEETEQDVQQDVEVDEEAQVKVETGEDEQQARFGIIGGPSLSYISADEDNFQEASDPLLRYSLGLHGEYTVHRAIGVSLETLFSRRGWQTEGAIGDQNLDSSYEFSYLDIPLMVRFGIPLAEAVAPKLMIGPHGSVFLDGSRGAETAGPFIDEEGRTDIDRDDINDVQFGLTAGLGIEFALPQGAITFDLRYMHNFTEVFDDPAGGDNVYHRSGLAMIGFLF